MFFYLEPPTDINQKTLISSWPLNKKTFNVFMLGDNSAVVPPDPMPNSEVKRSCADDSVGSPHAKVGHRQAPNLK